MKLLNAIEYYLLRTAVLPIEDSFDFIESTPALSQQHFIREISDPFIKKAFFLASPDFSQALDKYRAQERPLAADEKTLKSFYKYYTRMSSRCTPFGLFAGCALGEFAASTQIAFAPDKLKSISRLDMYYVSALSEYINSIPHLRRQLRFFPNETLYPVGDDFRYVEFSTVKAARKYRLSSFKGNDVIRDILRLAGAGTSYTALVESLRDKQYSAEESTGYVDTLIEAQILVSDLLPTVTGEEFYHVLIARLRVLEETEELVADLEKVNKLITSGDWREEVTANVKAILEKYVSVNTKDIVQTDLYFQTEHNALKRGVVEEIAGLVEECASLQRFGNSLALMQFIKKFEAKYGDQEVPLLVALDTETGIGYQATDPEGASFMPLLDNIHVPQGKHLSKVTWGAEKEHALKVILDAIQNKQDEVDLKASQVAGVRARSHANLPDSMFLFGSLLARSPKDLDEGNFQFLLNSVSGPSGANLLARFCHGDAQLEAKVKETLQKEERLRPDEVYAEVVHLPDGRTGNVIMRPTLRPYEIPILTSPSVDNNAIIRLQDLTVSISGGAVVLRSKKLNKRVVPRLTNAHNYAKGLHIYRFLCDLQNQGLDNLSFWSWSIFKQQAFLPRVKYGKLILSRATWNLKKADFLEAEKRNASTEYFQELQDTYRIPDKVVLVEGDNELLLSLSSELSLKILSDKLKKRDVVLQEYLFTPENCFIKDSKGSYTNELVVPFFTQKSRLPAARLMQATQPEKIIKRDFHVGEPWLYFRIYTGSKTADRLLVEAIKPLAESLLVEGVIEKWFFIRYEEQGHHLRIRFFHANRGNFWSTVVQRMNECLGPFQENGLVYKVQLETYQREIERYGSETIELSESLFFYDSIAVAEFLELLDGDKGEEFRWLFALLNVDRLLNDFGLSLYEKFQLVSQLREYFYQEANMGSLSKKLWISLNNGYRAKAKEIYEILEKGTHKKEDVSEAVNCFERRSERNRPVTHAVIRLLGQQGHSERVPLSSFLSSHIHMTLNRIFLAKQRIHETVVYHYLAKYYDSKIAREESASRKLKMNITA